MSAAKRRTYARVGGWECACKTLYIRGARASLLTWAGALPRPWLPDSARVPDVKGARSKGGAGSLRPSITLREPPCTVYFCLKH